MTSRRSFLRGMAAATASLSAADLLAIPRKRAENISLQLYSLRDAMGREPVRTLEAVAKAGYTLVEHAGYNNGKFYGMTPGEFKKVLTGNGLKMPSGHTVLQPAMLVGGSFFNDQWKQTVADAAQLGQQYVISPWMPEEVYKNADELTKFMRVFNKAGQLCQQHGMKFGYHNHDFEMSKLPDGQVIYEVMLQNTDPKLVTMQMDVAWVTAPGSDPLYWFSKYPGRFELLHMKDVRATSGGQHKYESTEIGQGIVKFPEILKHAAQAGARYFVVEQEEYGNKTPLEAVTIDYQQLSKLMA